MPICVPDYLQLNVGQVHKYFLDGVVRFTNSFKLPNLSPLSTAAITEQEYEIGEC